MPYLQVTLGFDIYVRQNLYQKLTAYGIPRYNERGYAEPPSKYQAGKKLLIYLTTMATTRFAKVQFENANVNKDGVKSMLITETLRTMDRRFLDAIDSLFMFSIYSAIAKSNDNILALAEILPTLVFGRSLDRSLLVRLQSFLLKNKQNLDTFQKIDQYVINLCARYLGLQNKNVYEQLLNDVFEYYVQQYNTWANTIILFPVFVTGTMIVYHAIIEKIQGTDIILKLDYIEFTKFLKEIVENIDTDWIFVSQNKHPNHPIHNVKYKINIQTSKTDVSSADLISNKLKVLYSNLPQNVFVYDLHFLDNHGNSELLHQNPLYHKREGKVKINKPLVQAEQIQKILQYTSQHHQLYMYYNRKTTSRKYFFDTISKLFFKPRSFSPHVPHFYTIQLDHVIKRSPNKQKPFYHRFAPFYQLINDNEHIHVNLNITQFVEKYLLYVLHLISYEFRILSVARPTTGVDYEMITIYPVEHTYKETKWDRVLLKFTKNHNSKVFLDF